MKILYALAGTLFAALLSLTASAATSNMPQPEWLENAQIGEIFAANGVVGTFVIYDREKNVMQGLNHQRAQQRFRPASTYKILNSLIAFETGVVKDASQIIPYGGKPQPIKAWERDMNIREAIAVSNVPVYQEIARRIGQERMQYYVQRLRYGNGTVGSKVDDFWLVGPLEISAMEQVQFLDALTQGHLPFSARSVQRLRDIMPQEKTAAGEMFFKTGLAKKVRLDQPDTGWLVGWTRVQGKDYPFALNIDISKDADVELRIFISRKILKKMGM